MTIQIGRLTLSRTQRPVITYTADLDINYGAGFTGGCHVVLDSADLRVLAASASALADEIERETAISATPVNFD